LSVGGSNTAGNEEFERKKVKQPLEWSCGAQIMMEIVEARWEIMRNISAVTIRARATAIVTEFGVEHHAGIKISLSVLFLGLVVDQVIAHVAQ
jgi:hypothetical protein